MPNNQPYPLVNTGTTPLDNSGDGGQIPFTKGNEALASLVQSPAEIAAGVVPQNFSWLPLQPERYGAKGDGVTDDTLAMTSWAAVVNASTNPVANWSSSYISANGTRAYLTQPLPVITAANLTLNASGATILANPASTGPILLQVSGVGATINGLTVNGNQNNFASAIVNCAEFSGNDLTLKGCTFSQSAGYGLFLNNVAGGVFENVEVTYNAGTGAQLNTCSYLKFTDCDFSPNGLGFKVQAPLNVPGVGFNCGVRFRSHHITFVGCSFDQGGLDGLNINQGSYAIKVIGCTLWRNGDGGLTVAGDNTHTGNPGEAESCYDIEYIDCESYDNWGGGLVMETSMYNITVTAGRYYNNNRAAGYISYINSTPNGIYVADGSQGILIDGVKCYDDRQICPVTASSVSGSTAVLTATNWGTTANWGVPLTSPNFTATAGNYPRVALYNASMAFQGYANITAESAGSVSISSAANNGVTLSSIASGWFVSQKVQHYGVLFDAGCQGKVKNADIFGCLPGPVVLTGQSASQGYKVYAVPSNGTNVIVDNGSPPSIQLLANPSWESSPTTGWTYTGTGSNAAYTTTGSSLYSLAAVELTSSSNSATYSGQGSLISSGANWLQNNWCVWAVTATCTQYGGAFIQLGNGPYLTTVYHPGTGTVQLRIGFWAPIGSAPYAVIGVQNSASVVFDEGSLYAHFEPYDERDYTYPTRNLAV